MPLYQAVPVAGGDADHDVQAHAFHNIQVHAVHDVTVPVDEDMFVTDVNVLVPVAEKVVPLVGPPFIMLSIQIELV